MSRKQNNRRANLSLLIFDCPGPSTAEFARWCARQGPVRLLDWTLMGKPIPPEVVREIAEIFDNRFTIDDPDLTREKIYFG